MTWLSDLKKYSIKYTDLLQQYGFKTTTSKDGPGMGACIMYANNIIELCLINDRDQYFINLKEIGGKKYYDLSVLLAIIKARQQGVEIRKLNKKEKIVFWELNYDYKDPFPNIFNSYNELCYILDKINIKNTIENIKAYYKDRGKWLFP